MREDGGGASAGGSAREVARRSRAKAERLMRHAELYERGAAGEERTAEVLGALPPEWTVLHDVRWPGRRLANIDHIVIGPAGIFVIDSKNWSGRVVVDGQVLRQNGRSREQAVAGCADAGLAVGELVAALAAYVVPVLCFVRDEPVTGWARDVAVCSTDNLLTMLTTRPPQLTADQVRAASREIDARLRAAAATAATAATLPATRRPNPVRRPPSARPKPRSRRRGRKRKNQTSLVELVVVLALGLWLIGPGHRVIADALVHAVNRAACSSSTAGAHVTRTDHANRPAHRARQSGAAAAQTSASCPR